MKVKVKKLQEDAVIPEFAHSGDAGMDLFSVEAVFLEPGQRQAIKTGIAFDIPQGYVGLVWDKSGRAVKEGLTVLAGVIDSSYRGEVQVVLLNTSDKSVEVEKGQKIAQMLIQAVEAPEVEEVEELDDTSRGEGGFGSTGLN